MDRAAPQLILRVPVGYIDEKNTKRKFEVRLRSTDTDLVH
jgi:hypothetical protein